MLKVIGIAGSPRRKGNSATLLEAALKGAAGAGAEVETVRLNELEPFRGCQGCLACLEKGECAIKDALTPVVRSLAAAEVWVLAAPIYFDGVSGQMKTFFDRLFWLCWQGGERKARLAGRRRAAVIVTNEDKPRKDYHHEAEKLAFYLSWMGDFGEVEIVSEGRRGPAGAAAERPELLARAEELGRKLAGKP